MISDKRVALVTGANRGIGFEIVRKLCKEFDGDVFLTARNVERGRATIEALRFEGLLPRFRQLDVTDENSIERLKVYIQAYYGGLDVLINNAAVSYKKTMSKQEEPLFCDQAQNIINTNFTGTLNVCEAFIPILRPHARVVNISSMASRIGIRKCCPELRKRILSSNLTMEGLVQEMQKYVSSVKTNTHSELGWKNSPYAISKIGIVLMTFIQQKQLRHDPRKDIVVNTCCPGIVSKDKASRNEAYISSEEEGADTPVYLALLPKNIESPTGQYVFKRQVQAWGND